MQTMRNAQSSSIRCVICTGKKLFQVCGGPRSGLDCPAQTRQMVPLCMPESQQSNSEIGDKTNSWYNNEYMANCVHEIIKFISAYYTPLTKLLARQARPGRTHDRSGTKAETYSSISASIKTKDIPIESSKLLCFSFIQNFAN